MMLHDMLGRDLSEVAVLLDITVAAAQSRLVRGRKELERRLSGAPREGSQ
jgi:DNA-directed RNA polymerase specialized sigma24 family protein